MRLDRINNPIEPFEDIWPKYVVLVPDKRHHEELAMRIRACMIEAMRWGDLARWVGSLSVKSIK